MNEASHERREIDSIVRPNAPAFKFGWRELFWYWLILGTVGAGGYWLGVGGFLAAVILSGLLMWILALPRGIRRWKAIWKTFAYGGGLFLVVVFALMLPQSGSGPVSPRNSCLNNMREIGLALLDYQQLHGSFPPAYTVDQYGKPLMSWRTAILPFIEYGSVYAQYHPDVPWDSAANLPIARTQLSAFWCPIDDAVAKRPSDTSYVAVVGPRTIWGIGTGLKGTDVKDRLFDTLMVVEMKNSGIGWGEPRDLDLDHLPAGLTRKDLFQALSNHSGGFDALFADGHTEIIPVTIPWSQFVALTTIDGGEKIDRSTWGE
jgi:prepilin-type processing-associated H-X9-DG protein